LLVEASNSEYEEGLRWRLELLKLKFEEGKINFAPEVFASAKASLSKVQTGKDGKIDLSTVDSLVRSLAGVVSVFHERDKLKSAISLREVSLKYFEILEANFGSIAKQALELKLDPHQAALSISNDYDAVKEFARAIPDLLEDLKKFWEALADPADYHIQDLTGTKAVYGGDLFPSYKKNIASSVGLYVDTIVLSDPITRSKEVLSYAPDKSKVYYLFKHALNALSYKELSTADLATPIVAVTPFRSTIDKHEADFLHDASQADALRHAEELFGREFETAKELQAFCENLDTPAKVVQSLSEPRRLLFDTDWKEPLEEQIARALTREWGELTRNSHPGHLVAGTCLGRMVQATDLLFKSRYLSGVPLVDAPTSWQYLNWKLEYNAAAGVGDSAALHMSRGLQRASEFDEQWLGKIPSESLIEMRRQGAFQDIRNAISKGVSEIAATKPEAFFRSSDKIVENIRDAFERHSKEVKQLKSRWIKFAGHDLGSMLIAGGIDVASIITGTPTFGAASFAVNQLVDVPRLRNIPERFRELKNAHLELKKSPMGLFFRHRK
jgi:hypothetical protein